MDSLPVLETDRLQLRSFALTDATAVQELAGAVEIASMTANIPHPYLDGMAEEWIGGHAEAFARGELANQAITLRSTAELIGAIGLVISAQQHRAELGYWIGRPYWGRGYCTEAARAIVAFGFEQLDLHRIVATHFARNPASGRVMQKLGMAREGLLRQHLSKGTHYEDLVCYGLLRSEWQAVLGREKGTRAS